MTLPGPYQACIFDLDGVIVDTAKYHYLAWKQLARQFAYDFTPADNEQLKGVSRTQSLEHILKLAGLSRTNPEKEALCQQKNKWYLDFVQDMTPAEILPGSVELIQELRSVGIKVGLGSASKNAPLILDTLGITPLFDCVMDGNKVQKAKPNPEVFLRAAQELQVPPERCIVFEDAQKGIQAAKEAGMLGIGIGDPTYLSEADYVMPNFENFTMADLSLIHQQYCQGS